MRVSMAAIVLSALLVTPMNADPLQLDALKKGDRAHGFRAEAVYLNDEGRPMGARFIHESSGFTLDYLQIESVPQGYTWVNSFPVGDQGEPHTQEHLLLGKGTKGRSFAGLDTMWLSSSTAFTQQWQTSYHFSTSAGTDVFFKLFAAELDALLHPNYTDEEIRREVRHFGVATAGDGKLRLEEKGSVYNEMTSSSANRYRVLFRELGHLAYGTSHPLAYNSGGEPSGIRTMQPEDIRTFHAANYYLGNMGTMVAFPKSLSMDEVLTRTGKILDSVESGPGRPSTTARPLPAPQPAAAGTIRIGEFPNRNDQQPGPLAFLWPPTRNLPPEDFLLMNLFADTFASDATTNIYKLFVDSKSRKMDLGATSVFNQVSSDQGNPFAIILDNVGVSNLEPAKIAAVRQLLTGEIGRIAAMEDGSAELKEFNERALNRITENERDLANFVNTPPAWGGRGTGSSWLDQLKLLARTSEFRKSVTLAPQLASIRESLQSGKNIWRDALTRWNVLNTVPYAAAARPSPELLQREEAERAERAEAEARRLAAQYGLEDTQAAIARYNDEYEAESARIEALAKDVAPPEFVSNPPMTLDDGLQFATSSLKTGPRITTSTFENMSSATLGLALRVDGVSSAQLRHLSLLPALMTRVGVIEDGKPVSFDEMSERLRKEILNLNANFSTNARTGRVELVVRGSGLGEEEATRAIDWMSLVLHHPDWRPENLPRIRDVVDQTLSALRNTMQGSEESWVNNPATAYRVQMNAPFLAADSFLTRGHNALRLRWLLRDAAPVDRDLLARYLTSLAENPAKKNREELKTLLAAAPVEGLSDDGKAVAADVHKDLGLTLGDIPDESLAADWTYLVTAIRDDLMTPSSETLSELTRLREDLVHRMNARLFFVASPSNQQALTPRIEALAASLSADPSPKSRREKRALIDERVLGRESSSAKPAYVGLLAPNMSGGVIITSVPSAHFSDFNDQERQLDYLTSRLHAGYGAHGVFLKTLAAGLAYSNGLRGNVQSGHVGYYAERTPEIPQTVRFVVDTLKKGEADPRLGDYAVAQVFGETRAAATYEARAEGIANDLADQQPPDLVRRFRASILELRKDPELGAKLFSRKDKVYATMLPGYAKGTPAGTVNFAIGPEKQLSAWERYLAETEGEEGKLVRLYPRDFWIP